MVHAATMLQRNRGADKSLVRGAGQMRMAARPICQRAAGWLWMQSHGSSVLARPVQGGWLVGPIGHGVKSGELIQAALAFRRAFIVASCCIKVWPMTISSLHSLATFAKSLSLTLSLASASAVADTTSLNSLAV